MFEFPHQRHVFGIAAASLLGSLVACASNSTSSGSSSPPPPAADVPPAASNSPSTSAPSASGEPKTCGCALCEPVVSDDACTTDADCAPSVPCHAPKCIAKAKAVPKTPDTMCTMIMSCTSADSNICGCLKGKCSLYPKAS